MGGFGRIGEIGSLPVWSPLSSKPLLAAPSLAKLPKYGTLVLYLADAIIVKICHIDIAGCIHAYAGGSIKLRRTANTICKTLSAAGQGAHLPNFAGVAKLVGDLQDVKKGAKTRMIHDADFFHWNIS